MSELTDGAEAPSLPKSTWIDGLTPKQLEECREAKRQTKLKKLNASQVARNIVEKFDVSVSYRTVQRWLTDGKN